MQRTEITVVILLQLSNTQVHSKMQHLPGVAAGPMEDRRDLPCQAMFDWPIR